MIFLTSRRFLGRNVEFAARRALFARIPPRVAKPLRHDRYHRREMSVDRARRRRARRRRLLPQRAEPRVADDKTGERKFSGFCRDVRAAPRPYVFPNRSATSAATTTTTREKSEKACPAEFREGIRPRLIRASTPNSEGANPGSPARSRQLRTTLACVSLSCTNRGGLGARFFSFVLENDRRRVSRDLARHASRYHAKGRAIRASERASSQASLTPD